MSISLSNAANIWEEGWWMDVMTVRLPDVRALSVCVRTSAVLESSPEVGSSSRSRDGLISSSLPMFRRLRSPPDTPRCIWPPTMLLAALPRLSTSITSSTLFNFSASDCDSGNRRRAVSSRIWRTVRDPWKRSSCMTYPIRRLSELPGARPLNRISPVTFLLRRRPRMLRSVVLPEPVGPMMAINSPGRTCPVTLNKICFWMTFLPSGSDPFSMFTW
mmetsp:Transcript_7951/g.20033  ORF Transcript_7951/g.20033 Transcript_7951/m.20033 type:complete len:217 (+) Transcript_7951:1153-1803(+)